MNCPVCKATLTPNGELRECSNFARCPTFVLPGQKYLRVDFELVKILLKSPYLKTNKLAQSYLKFINERGFLTSNQLVYVIGTSNPKDRPTLQQLIFSRTGVKPSVGKIFKITTEPEQTTEQQALQAPRTEQVDIETEKIIVKGDEPIIKTEDFSYIDYSFESFNPLQSVTVHHIREDMNVVVASSTSSGKTIVAEQFIAPVVENGEKAIYISPLKALTQEKFDDWTSESHTFSNYKIEIITGDYILSADRVKEIEAADIILLTSEMLASRTIKVDYEKNHWLKDVGVMVIDECLPGTTKVRISSNYEVPISRICSDDSFTHVMSYNKESNIMEKKKILRKIKNNYHNNLVSITYEVNGKSNNLVCTLNHKIWTERGYVQAMNLIEGDILKILPIDKQCYCEICSKQWSNDRVGKIAFQGHYYTNHIANYCHFCSVCDRKFKRKEDKTNHKCFHKEKNLRHKCNFCDKVFRFKSALISHMLIDHKICYLYTCSKCGHKFKNVMLLRKHYIDYHVKKFREHWKNIDWKSVWKLTREKENYKKSMKLMGERRTGYNNPIFNNGIEAGYTKMKEVGKKRWANLPEYRKIEQIKRFKNAPIYTKGLITSLEKKIINYGFKTVYYTGDGSFWLSFKNGKRKNPDFIVKGQRKVIEVGDFTYWHTLEEAEEVKHQYALIDYKCLYLTDVDINNKWELTINKINTFIQNHEAKVINVKRWGRQMDYVYNLEVEDNHNYIANDVLVSNCHLLGMEGRGDHLESAMMRFSAINPKCKIIALSATMPNVKEIASWLTLLNGKKSLLIKSEWRPVQLDIHYETYLDSGTYSRKEENKYKEVINLLRYYKDDKFIVFVHTKSAGRRLHEKIMRELNEKAEFHSADLTKAIRNRLEKSFKDKDSDLRILISTSTIAYGCNLPARRVIIVGVHRGLDEVTSMDVQQMCGRSGRYGIDIKGDAYVLVPSSDKEFWVQRISKSEDILSRMIQAKTIAFHVITEVVRGVINNRDELQAWYERSLAYFQRTARLFVDNIADIEAYLTDCNAMKIEDGIYIPTNLGRIAAWMYFKPHDVKHWFNAFSMAHEQRINIEWDAVWLAWALSIESPIDYVPTDINAYANAFYSKCESKGIRIPNNRLLPALGIYHALTGESSVYGSLTPIKRALIYDIDRMVGAIKMIDVMYAKWGYPSETYKVIRKMITYEVGRHLVDLCSIRNIGKVKATQLYAKGITTYRDMLNSSNKEKIENILKKNTADSLEHTRELISDSILSKATNENS